MNGQARILSLYAFTVVDDDGTEGVVGLQQIGPLVGADLAMVALLEPVAQKIATTIGKPLTLAHFSVRTDQKVINPI